MSREREYEVTYSINIRAKRTIVAHNDDEMWEIADRLRDDIELEVDDDIEDVDIIGIYEF